MEEIFIPIKDYEGIYEVSNLGRIKALPRMLPHYKSGFMIRKQKLLKTNTPHRTGYKLVSLTCGGKVKQYSVHRLVASHFIPNPDNLPEVNHKDAIKSNNHVSNLEWSTRLNNQHHAIERGLTIIHRGENHGMSVLTDEKILKIRELYKSNPPTYRKKYSYGKIAKMFGVSRPVIAKIIKRQSWAHV